MKQQYTVNVSPPPLVKGRRQKTDKKLLKWLLPVMVFFAFVVGMPMVSWGQTTIFSENMGSPTATTAIIANTFQNSGTLTYSNGGVTNSADCRNTNASSGYTGSSASGNVFFTTATTPIGFAIEGINASGYTSLSLKFAYRKESTTVLPTFTVDYWDGSAYQNVPFTFNEAANAATGWYLAPTISLPSAAQISTLKLRWTKSGTAISVRLDDVVLTGTASTPTITPSTSSIATTTYVAGSGPATANTFSVSGASLTSSPLTFDNLTNFEVSTDGGTTFGTSKTLAFTIPTLGSTTISVRMKSGLSATTYNETLHISGGGATTQNITLSGTVTAPTPTITLTPSTPITTAAYTVGSGPGAASSFAASGSNLTSSPLTFNGLTSFEVSTDGGSTYGSSKTLAFTIPTLGSTTIYVRLKAGLSANSYNETLSISGGGATTQTIALSGTVNPLVTPFASGNLAALVAADNGSSNTTVSLIEVLSGTGSQSSPVSNISVGATGANAIRSSGSASSTLYLSHSNDGRYAVFTGHNTTTTAGNINTIQTKGVVTFDNAKNFALATTYTGTGTNQARSATTVNNSTYFIGDNGGFYSNGTSTASPSGNYRGVKAFGGTVYAFSASATSTNTLVGTIATATGATYTNLSANIPNASTRQDFYLIQSGSNGSTYDVLYVLDATTATAGTIYKYSLVSGSWTANGTYTTSFGGFGLCAQAFGAGANLFVSTGTGATAANSIVKLYDAGGYNQSINITTGNNVTLYTATSPATIKGIDFAPAPTLVQDSTALTTNMTYTVGAANGTQTNATFRLNGYGLTSGGTVTFTLASSNFDISTASDFSTALSSITLSSSNLANTPIYVRLKSGKTVNSYTDVLTIASTGAASLTVNLSASVSAVTNPTVTTQPSTTPASYCQNTISGSVTALTVASTIPGSGTISGYQWYSNAANANTGGTLISGATAASYTPSTATAGTLYYYCAVINSFGGSTNSNVSGLITITLAPTVTVTANHIVHYTAQMDTFTVAVSGTGIVASTYQWTKNGTPVTVTGSNGANTATYSENLITWADQDKINCTVTATNGCAAAATVADTLLVPTATAFGTGNLVCYRVNTSYATTSTSAATRIFIDEFNKTTGNLVRSIPMPYSKGVWPQDANYSLTASGTATSEGYMTLSSDGKSLVVPGYNAYEGRTSVAGTNPGASPTNKNDFRVIGKVDFTGIASVPFAANFLGGNNIRSVASDGTRLWAVGANGFYYFNDVTDNSANQYSGVNARSLTIFNGKLWGASAATGNIGIDYFGDISSLRDNGTLGTTLVADSTGYANAMNQTKSASPYGYTFNPTGDTMYVADDDANNFVTGASTPDANGGGILKYYFNNATGKYTLLGRMVISGLNLRGRSIVGDFSGQKTILYATTLGNYYSIGQADQDSIISLTDNGGLSATLNWATKTTPYANLRAVAFAPSASQTPYTFISSKYHGTTFNSTFPTTIANVASTNSGNNSFAFAGKFIGTGGVTVTPPVGFEISTSSSFSTPYANSTPYTVTQQDLFDTSTRSVQVIYVRFKPTVGGTYDDSVKITTTGGVTKYVRVTGYCSTPQTVYYKGGSNSSNILTPSSWTTSSTLIGGTSPATMSDSNYIWNFTGAATLTLPANWFLGYNSSILLTNGKLTVPSTATINTTTNGGLGIGIGATATLDWKNAVVPVFTSIATGSTVSYSGTIPQTLAQTTYSNLSLSGGSGADKTITGTIGINNNFTIAAGTNANAGTNSTVSFNGSGTAQSIPALNYWNLTLSNPAGCAASGVDSVYGTAYVEEGTFTVPTGATLFLSGSAASLSMFSSSQQVMVNGSFINGSSLGTAFTSFNGGTLTFGAGSNYYHTVNGGALPSATWNASSTCNITGVTSTALSSGYTRTFGNFTWNCPSQTVTQVINSSSFGTSGTLTITNTNTGSFSLISTLGSVLTNTFGNIVVSSGGKLIGATPNATYPTMQENITVPGNVTVTGTGIFDFASASNSVSSLAYPTILNLSGNLSIGASAKFYTSIASTNAFLHGKVVFQKSGTQLVNDSATTANNTDIDYIINSGSTVKLGYAQTLTYRSTGATDAITNNGTIDLNGNTLTFNTLTGSGKIKGSATSSLAINGTASNTLSLDQTTLGSSNLLSNLTLTNTGTTTLGNYVSLVGVLLPSAGTFAAGDSLLTLKSAGILTSGTVGPVLGTITGTRVTVERYIPKGYRRYRDFAPGVYRSTNTIFNQWMEGGNNTTGNTATTPGYGIFITGGTAVAGTTSTPNSISTDGNGFDVSSGAVKTAYTFTTGNWNAIPNTGLALNPFQGFRLLVRGDRTFNLYGTPIDNTPNGLLMYNATALRAKGQLITGRVTLDSTGVTNINSRSTNVTAFASKPYGLTTANDSSFNLVANPYVCPVDWKIVSDSSANIENYYYYLDPNYGTAGGYQAGNPTTAPNYIQAGQAIFIQNKKTVLPANPKLVFTETSKAPSSAKTYVFGSGSLSKMVLTLLKQIGGVDTTFWKMDKATLAFDSSFSNSYDGNIDVPKLPNASDNLSIKQGSNSLSIYGRKPGTKDDIIGLLLDGFSKAKYQLQVDATAYNGGGLTAFVYDSYLKTATALQPAVNTITFTADNAVAASYQDRFSIVFKPTILSVNSITASATLKDGAATVSWNTIGENKVAGYTVEKSTNGAAYTKIATVTAKNTASASYSAVDNNVASGTTYYRIKATSFDGSIAYSNVTSVTLATENSQFTLYPNPVINSKLNVKLENVNAGKYTVSIYNSLGQKVHEEAVSHNGGSAVLALSINSKLATGMYNITIGSANSKQVVYETSVTVE
ncbi:beta strand repeat-containing protein [Parasediminibacterium sp. JCM 36343]|uniref:beta strand repeat-containing protein n=1 Tax=Parasediminibacterium sp. JCM 36343 TaxID=3374279 RepID=UPI00397AFE15